MQKFSFEKSSCLNLWDFILSVENNAKMLLDNQAKSTVSKLQKRHAQKISKSYIYSLPDLDTDSSLLRLAVASFRMAVADP